MVSSFCTSGQTFAADFLQIRPRDRHPCLWLRTSRYRACRGLSPVRLNTCWANQKKRISHHEKSSLLITPHQPPPIPTLNNTLCISIFTPLSVKERSLADFLPICFVITKQIGKKSANDLSLTLSGVNMLMHSVLLSVGMGGGWWGVINKEDFSW